MKPVRVQRKRTKGYRMPPNTVSVTRPGIMGNPFPVNVYGQAVAVELHRRWLLGKMSTYEMSGLSRIDRWAERGVSLVTVREWALEEIAKHRGENVACYCGLDEPCHGDTVLNVANAEAA